MLRMVALGLQGLLLVYLAYELVVSLWGWPHPTKAPRSQRAQRFRVVIPAHNEGAVIRHILTDLSRQEYDRALVRVVVIADRSDDDTAAVAERLAEVAERRVGSGGKGNAIDWYLDEAPLDADEALVIFDADTRVPPESLARIADELATGPQACQLYLDVDNPDGSLVATASALSYWAGNRMVQLARHRIGWSADLGGTGMAFAADGVTAIGRFGGGLTEDQGALARLVASGGRVGWIHDVRLRDEKPQDVAVAVHQRARWVAGKRAVARAALRPLLTAAWAKRSWAPVDVAIRLVQPGRSFLALIAALLAAVAAVTGAAALLPWWLWALVAAVVVIAPVAFLVRDGVPGRYVVRYPVVALLAILWLPIRVMSRIRRRGWRRTPRRAEQA